MNFRIPEDWRPIPISDFEEFLKVCNDYTRDGWYNADVYAFRHDKKQFACVTQRDGRQVVLVTPDRVTCQKPHETQH